MHKLLENLKREGFLNEEPIYNAMLKVDRTFYSPISPYADRAQTIGHEATISAPHMHAKALEALSLKPGEVVGDAGLGSGYLAAVMAHIVHIPDEQHSGDKEPSQNKPVGTVYGIESVPEVLELARSNISKDNVNSYLLNSPRFKLSCGDAWKGFPDGVEFDAIHVGAAAPQAPKALVNQLKTGGRMVIPIGTEGNRQEFTLFRKGADGSLTSETLSAVKYVPLRHGSKEVQKEVHKH
eukprot:Filipodium_phascolosomae@DN2057_c0_g1_i1.p1